MVEVAWFSRVPLYIELAEALAIMMLFWEVGQRGLLHGCQEAAWVVVAWVHGCMQKQTLAMVTSGLSRRWASMVARVT